MEKKKIETFVDNNDKEGGGGAGNKYRMKELFFILTLNLKTNNFF